MPYAFKVKNTNKQYSTYLGLCYSTKSFFDPFFTFDQEISFDAFSVNCPLKLYLQRGRFYLQGDNNFNQIWENCNFILFKNPGENLVRITSEGHLDTIIDGEFTGTDYVDIDDKKKANSINGIYLHNKSGNYYINLGVVSVLNDQTSLERLTNMGFATMTGFVPRHHDLDIKAQCFAKEGGIFIKGIDKRACDYFGKVEKFILYQSVNTGDLWLREYKDFIMTFPDGSKRFIKVA